MSVVTQDVFISSLQILFNVGLQNIIGIVTGLTEFLFYLVNLKWVSDLASFPIVVPSFTIDVIKNVAQESLISTNFTSNNLTFFSYILQGFVCSLFLSIPISPIRMLTVQRWVVHGPKVGSITLIVVCLIQWVLFASTILGFVSIIQVWRFVSPILFVLGIILMFESGSIVTFERQKSFILGLPLQTGLFIAAEQTVFLPYFLTISNSLQTLPAGGFAGLNSNICYLIGLAIGLVFFGLIVNCLFSYLINGNFVLQQNSLYGLLRIEKFTFLKKFGKI